MRSSARVMAGLVVVAGVGFWWWQQSRAAGAAVQSVLQETEAELARTQVDRDALGRLRLRLLELPDADSDPDVVRALARVLTATGRFAEAWDRLSALAVAPDAEAMDLQLGADILRRVHALNGDLEDARQARALAQRHHDLTSDPASLLLAWQLAHRSLDGAEEARLRDQLLQEHPASLETELVTTWGAFFAPDGAERVPMDRLVQLENRFERVPLELDIMLIVALLQRSQDEADLGAAVDRAAALLPENQAIPDLRYYSAIIALLRGDQQAHDAHRDWLLKNAPNHPGARELR